MSRSTISTFQLFALFPDEETARTYLESRIWPNGPVCPDCHTQASITKRKAGYYRCNVCAPKLDFTVRTGTVMERSHVPLHKWLYSMYLVMTARKGISSLQLAKEIGITQKSAWFVLGRLREACGGNFPGDDDKLSGTVEVDECFVGGLEGNKHEADKLKSGRGAVGKAIVFGMRERGGRTHAKVVTDTTIETLQNEIHGAVEPGTQIYSDEHGGYSDLDGLFFKHETVNHGAGEYVRGNAHVNGMESVWAVLKRGLHGTFHHASKKHLHRYVDEFTFRLNEGNVRNHTTARLNSFVAASVGKRLTYKRLIGKPEVAA